MRMRRTALLFCMVGLTGCIPLSLHPLYTDADLVYDSGLEGTWGDEHEQWTFEKAGDDEYKLIVKSGDEPPDVFSAHLVQLKKYRFLDIIPTEVAGRSDFADKFLIPVHTFWQFERNGDAFRIRNFNSDWLKDRFEKGRLHVPHEEYEDWFILTAEPKRLQRFVLHWINNDEAFGDWDEPIPRYTAGAAGTTQL